MSSLNHPYLNNRIQKEVKRVKLQSRCFLWQIEANRDHQRVHLPINIAIVGRDLKEVSFVMFIFFIPTDSYQPLSLHILAFVRSVRCTVRTSCR